MSLSGKDMVAEGGDCMCEDVRGDCAERGCVGEKGGGTCWVGVDDGTSPAGDVGLSAVPGGWITMFIGGGTLVEVAGRKLGGMLVPPSPTPWYGFTRFCAGFSRDGSSGWNCWYEAALL